MSDKNAYDYNINKNKDDESRDIPPEVLAVIAAFKEMAAGRYDRCIRCGDKLTALQQVGRCVYGSCGCRQYQGRIPKDSDLGKREGDAFIFNR